MLAEHSVVAVGTLLEEQPLSVAEEQDHWKQVEQLVQVK